MPSQKVVYIGSLSAFLGWLGVLVVCSLPRWRVTAFSNSEFIPAEIIWEGLWKACVMLGTGQMYCHFYEPSYSPSMDLLAARAMIIISIVAGAIGILISIILWKFTKYVVNTRAKTVVCMMGGVAFMIAGVLCLIPVSWRANSVVVDFYNPLFEHALQWEMGTCLYIGWVSAGLMLLGGALLCWNCPPKCSTSTTQSTQQQD